MEALAAVHLGGGNAYLSLCSWNEKRMSWLKGGLLSLEWNCHHAVDGERDVDDAENDEDGISIFR